LKPASDYFIENHLLTATDSTIRIADTSINSKLASVIRKTLAGVASLDQEISVIDSDFILDHLPDLKNLAKRRDSLQLLINAVCSYCTSPLSDIDDVALSLRNFLELPRYVSPIARFQTFSNPH
jgi:hypothetical protein